MVRGQKGFTIIELVAVIAILSVLTTLVAGAVTGLASSGQDARLAGDQNSIGKAADRFRTEAFPSAYPVVSCCATTSGTPQDILQAGDVGVRLIDFDAHLPQSPTRTFTPHFLQELPDSAGLVSWRIDARNGNVFFARDGAQLVRPSTNRLDVAAFDSNPGAASSYTMSLRMEKSQAALKVLTLAIPTGYGVGGQSLAAGTHVGTFTGTLAPDNPWVSGEVIPFTGTLKTTGTPNRWVLFVDYPNSLNNHPTLGRGDRSHNVIIVTPTESVPGTLTIELNTSGDPAHNQATERWALRIYGTTEGGNHITNPSAAGVYRWLAKEHTAIDVNEFFDRVDGNQAVAIRVGPTPEPGTPGPTPTPTSFTGRIVFATNRDGNYEIYRMRLDGSGQTRLTTNFSADDLYPDWSANGAKIAFSSNRDGNHEIYVMNADGSGQTRLTTNFSASDLYPDWSPDGSKIAFSSNQDGNYDIYVMNANGSGPVNLTDDFSASNLYPAWSPDGAKIAFSSNRDGNYEIYSMNANGSSPVRLTTNATADDLYPAWSPDGAKIAFSSNRDGNYEIYVMNATGSSPVRLTTNATAVDTHPGWLSDGSKIAFASDRDGNYEIYLMNANGSGQIRLTTNASDADVQPDLGPSSAE